MRLSSGRNCSRISLRVVRVECVDRLMAPIDLSAAVQHRHGQRAQAAFELFVDDGELLLAIGADAIEQGLQVGDGLRRVGFDPL